MQELSMISTSLPLGIHDFIQDVFSAIPLPLSYQVCLWDGTMLKEQVASSVYSPLKVTIRHPGVIRSLILKRDLLVLADAYLNGYLVRVTARKSLEIYAIEAGLRLTL
jgi:cyclopropane-fatty-acyl-phospholipid synthase